MSASLFETRRDIASQKKAPASRRAGLRRLTYTVHLWLGAFSMAYLLLVSVSGCAMLFSQELYELFSPNPELATISDAAPRLDSVEFKQAVQDQYPQAAIVALFDKELASGTVMEVWLEQGATLKRRLFNPYTGVDLGTAEPWPLRVLAVLRSLHTELLSGWPGRVLNTLGALSLIVLSTSGAVMGWKRLRRRRQQSRKEAAASRHFATVHRIIGIWASLFALIWGFTGACLAWPLLTRLSGMKAFLGEQAFQTLYNLHLGITGGWPMRIVWAISALALVFLVVTGAVMWWKRTLNFRAGPHKVENENLSESAAHFFGPLSSEAAESSLPSASLTVRTAAR